MSTTQTYTVGPDWVQVSDGASTRTIQVMKNDWCYLFESDTKPDANETGHIVNDFMTITAPTIAWVRSMGGVAGTTIDVVVS